MDYFDDVFDSSLCFWDLNVSVVLPYMQGQKALGFHQINYNKCSEDEEGLMGLERHEGE